MNVLVKYPTRSRLDLFRRNLARWLSDPIVRALVTIDADDPTMNVPAVRAWLAGLERVSYRVGHSRSKIEAINDGVAEADWDLLLLAADDMVPQRTDYASRIVELFAERFPDGDGVLHLNDGRAGRVLNTFPIIDRRYFDRTRAIYHRGYASLWADNEMQEVSEGLGRAAYVDEIIVKHEWIGATAPDALHERNESFYAADQRVYERRRAGGFDGVLPGTVAASAGQPAPR